MQFVAKEQRLKQIEDELASFGSESVHLQQKAYMLKHIGTLEQLLLVLKLLPQVVDGLQLVHTIQQVANVLDNLLLFLVKLDLLLNGFKGLIDAMVFGDGALKVVSVDIEQGLGLLGQTDRCDALCARCYPVILQDLFLTLGRVRQHTDDVDASASQRKELCVLGKIYDRLDQVLLLDQRDTVLVGADVTDGPQSSTLLE